ncbi:MAG: DNA cytosine methyltransferase [Bryobacterales bacterium]|nr:DNA cytosine methyltransferase [Bryobacterales bacterium]
MRSVELFTGAGGLALGIEKAGFHHHTVVERDKDCCETIRQNQRNGYPLLEGWRLYPGDVKDFEYSAIKGEVDLLAGGPPCQPFSIGGKHKAHEDRRDMFPQVVRAVREPRPRAIMVENVKGLTRKTFANYFSYIVLHSATLKSSGERTRIGRSTARGWRSITRRAVGQVLSTT